MSDATVVFRSAIFAECEERAFVLTAVGIPNRIGWDGARHALVVEAPDAVAADHQLRRYESERRAASAPPPAPPPDVRRGAGVGVAVYVAVLLGVSYAIALGIGPLAAFDLGELVGSQVQSGEWWRALTALTLHRDGAHLLGNLGFGAAVGYFAGRRLGGGAAWLFVVAAAACANFLNASFGPAEYHSVGASTAVFAALGLLSGLAWRERASGRQKWMRRLGPLFAGLALLGWTGSEGETTDLVAHALGFALGVLAGALAAAARIRASLARAPQAALGAAALALLATGWALALTS
jgi:membrane associated rhomboid family serine protease